MDKQQSAREALYKLSKWHEHPADTAYRDGVDAGHQAAQAALMPALVEARDALESIDGHGLARTSPMREEQRRKALITLNAVLKGSK